MDLVNSSLTEKTSNDHHLIDCSYTNFRNEDYILKLNTLQMLKFFKDELTIKYTGKGFNLIDYAVFF